MLYNNMIKRQLIICKNLRNSGQLYERIDYKIYRAISSYDNYQTQEFQNIFSEIIKFQSLPLAKIFNRLDDIIRYYYEAFVSLFQKKIHIDDMLKKWTKLENQGLFSRPYLQIGNIYEKMQKFDKAIQYYQKCIQKFDNNDKAYYFKGRVLLQTRQIQQGLDFLRLGIRINSKNIKILQAFGLCYQRENKLSIALKYFYLIQQIKPNQNIANKIQQLIQKQEQSNKNKKTQKESEKTKIKINQKIRQYKGLKNSFKSQSKSNSNLTISIMDKSYQPELKKINKHEQRVQITKNQKPNKVICQIKNSEQPSLKMGKKLSEKEKIIYNKGMDEIFKNPLNNNNYWKLMTFLKQKNMQDEVVNIIELLIKDGKREYVYIFQICKQIEEIFYIFAQKRKIIDLLSTLQKYYKLNIFAYLYHTYLAILYQDREQAKQAIKSCKIATFVDQWLQNYEGNKDLIQNYIYLFDQLIRQESLDLLSLAESFKAMINFLQRCYEGQQVIVQNIIKQVILLKNLLAQCTNDQVSILLYLENVDIKSVHKHISEILIKEKKVFIASTSGELLMRISKCNTIIVFPQTLQLLGEKIDGMRIKLNIIVIKVIEKDYSAKYEALLKDIKMRNGRLKIQIGMPFIQVYSWLDKLQLK